MIQFKEISILEAIAMKMEYKDTDLYFRTIYSVEQSNGGYQPRKQKTTELFLYDSKSDSLLKRLFGIKNEPKSVLGIGQRYVKHMWYVKEYVDENEVPKIPKPPRYLANIEL